MKIKRGRGYKRASHPCLTDGIERPGPSGKCRLCLTEHARRYRADGRYKKRVAKEYLERKKKKPFQLWAMWKIKLEVKMGRMPKVTTLLCVDCGKPAKCYDHRDYLKPLDVEPVCISCNKLRGAAMNASL